jgi:hypothetical protein
LRSDQTLACQSKQHAAYQNGRIALGISTNGDGELEDSDSDSEGDQSDPYSQIVDEETDEEGGKNIGESEDGIEQLELGLAYAQIFLHVLLEGLRIVESVLVTEDHHGDEEEYEEAYLLTAEGLRGILHACAL